MQQMIQGNKFVGRLSAEAGLGADGIDPLHYMAIEFRVAAHRRIHTVASLNQTRQDVVDVGNGECVVRTKIAHGAFLPGPQAVPQLALWVAFAAKQYKFAMGSAGDQHNDRFWLGETAQVLEVTFLTVHVLNVTITNRHRGRRQYCDAVGPHLRHERLAAACVFRFRDMNHGQTGFLLAIDQCSEGLAAAGSSGFLVSVYSNSGATRRYSITSM